MAKGKLVALPGLNQDGSQTLHIMTDEDQAVEMVLQPQGASDLLRQMQNNLLNHYSQGGEPPQFPLFQVERVILAHGAGGSMALLVETGQTGNLSLNLTPETASQMREELGRLIDYLPKRVVPN